MYQPPHRNVLHRLRRVYRYLQHKLKIARPNHVRCADVANLPMQRGFLYLIAIMDWAICKVLVWRLSNTMPTSCSRSSRKT